MKKSRPRKKKHRGIQLPAETKSWEAIKRNMFRRKFSGGKSK